MFCETFKSFFVAADHFLGKACKNARFLGNAVASTANKRCQMSEIVFLPTDFGKNLRRALFFHMYGILYDGQVRPQKGVCLKFI